MDKQKTSALSNLQDLGLTIEIDDITAQRVWANLLILDGRFDQRGEDHYSKITNSRGYLASIFHAIADLLVNEKTADYVIEQMIPAMTLRFFYRTGGSIIVAGGDREQMHIEMRQREILEGPIKEWKGKMILKRLDTGVVSESEGTAPIGEVERRASLLAAFKKATGNPVDYRIYNAKNSGIHKPEFYAWKKGTLSVDSATCIQFERFLKEAKPPISRKPRD